MFMLYAFFWVIPRRLSCSPTTYPPMKIEKTECSETLKYETQTLGYHLGERMKLSEQGESLKSRIYVLV